MKIKEIVENPIGQYCMWNGTTEDNRTICVFLANSVLHVEIFKNREDKGESRRISVDCPTKQMTTEEMMELVGLELMGE